MRREDVSKRPRSGVRTHPSSRLCPGQTGKCHPPGTPALSLSPACPSLLRSPPSSEPSSELACLLLPDLWPLGSRRSSQSFPKPGHPGSGAGPGWGGGGGRVPSARRALGVSFSTCLELRRPEGSDGSSHPWSGRELGDNDSWWVCRAAQTLFRRVRCLHPWAGGSAAPGIHRKAVPEAQGISAVSLPHGVPPPPPCSGCHRHRAETLGQALTDLNRSCHTWLPGSQTSTLKMSRRFSSLGDQDQPPHTRPSCPLPCLWRV